jgi:hypothetical protein
MVPDGSGQRGGGDAEARPSCWPAGAHSWWAAATAALAGGYLLIGLTSPLNTIGWPALAGGLLVLTALWLATRSRPAALTALITGALLPVPTTWWSLVVPATALMLLACGLLAVRTTHPGTAVVTEG